ncbi:MAG: PQQ-binding-like beta-propeller repeat protein, partial [Gemmatimonadaceae bacterium]|nr:PQQ-binding-like beta-propeller repeat protein [Gemmatimonadaceae bacterium]
MRQQLASVILILLAGAGAEAQWPQWRGPNRDGVVATASVPAAWPEKATLKWKQEVGEGYSSPVVADGRVFVHSRRDPEEIVSAFDLASGNPVWTERYQSSFNKNQYAKEMSKGPFSTPLVASGRVYTLGTSAVLTSFDAATGAVKWRKDWSKEIDSSKMFTGTAMSPVIDSGLLIVHVGDDTRGAFRAFDPLTGADKWVMAGHGPGYASPIIWTSGGARHLITMTDKAVVAVEVASGRLIWQIPFPDEWNENIVTPVVAGDTLVISGIRKGTFGYRIEKTGTTWSPKQIWHNADLPMYMSSPVADGDYIYGFSSKRKGQMFCVDAKTGTAKWATEGRGGMNAAIQSAGGNLVMLTSEGELIVAKRAPEKYEELRRYKVAESQTWGHPVLLGTQLVMRDASSIAVW